MVAKYQKKALLCVTATGTVLCSHGDLTRELCEPNCASTMTSASVRRSYHDLTAPWTRAQCDHRWPYSDVTTTYATALRCLDTPSRLLRTYDVRTTILRRPSAFRCIFGSIPLQLMFNSFFLNAITRFFYLENESWFHSSVNHLFSNIYTMLFTKVINKQYWKLHMLVLFRSSRYKYHTSFRCYRVNFCYW